ncbi:MAG: O-antigen ligase family protein [Lachnospiraceae bacterium]|nr:O-antigen ligase family protein [Lachnospiraceae bacterium]
MGNKNRRSVVHRHPEKNILTKLRDYTILIYLFAVLLVYPLYLENGYYSVAFGKWKFFLYVTILFLIVMLVCGAASAVRSRGSTLKLVFSGGLLSDKAAGAYLLLSLVTLWTCENGLAAWMGTEGWYMGLVAQLLFAFLYFSFFLKTPLIRPLVIFHGIGSACSFLIALLQRYGFDLLRLYDGMPDETVRDYLSTLGNRTWFAGYVCTAFPLGVYFFWKTCEKRELLASGVYVLLSFCCLATMNTDSVYAALFIVFYIILLLSLGSREKMVKFCLLLDGWFVSCFLMSGLRMAFSDAVRELRSLSCIFLNMRIAAAGLALAMLATGYSLWRQQNGREILKQRVFALRRLILGITAVVIISCILLIVLNTAGILERWFGFSITNSYFLFDDSWGDYRGGTWKLTVRMIAELPLRQKLFGIGQDCFAWYAYSNAEYSEILVNTWGSTILANAHNEWLNQWLCMGLVGGTAYLMIFIFSIRECLKASERKEVSPFVPAVGLCVAAYVVNDFFGYQQASAAPIIFILMGSAAGVLKRNPISNK